MWSNTVEISEEEERTESGVMISYEESTSLLSLEREGDTSSALERINGISLSYTNWCVLENREIPREGTEGTTENGLADEEG